MKLSTDHILTTHAGVLERPSALYDIIVVGHPKIARAKLQARAAGPPIAADRLWRR